MKDAMDWHGNRLETYFLETSEKMLDAKLQHVVSHSMPGRLRISIPILASRKELAECGSYRISTWQGVTEVKANHLCGSITIRYDSALVREEALLEKIVNTTVRDLIHVRNEFLLTINQTASHRSTCVNLKRAAVAVGLSVLCSGVSGLAVAAAGVFVFFVTIPIYKRSLRDLVVERKPSLDLVFSVLITLGILSGHVIITSLSVWFMYFGDYMGELASPDSTGGVAWLRPARIGDGPVTDNTRIMRIAAGFATLIIGLPMIPLPGPGVVVTTVGLRMLAPEFPWAKRFYKWITHLVKRPAELTSA